MSPPKMPHNERMANETLRNFSSLAYSIKYKNIFEEAVYIVYGTVFTVKIGLSKRMMFHCELCNKDMNNIDSLENHSRSGTHQKNKDKEARENQGFKYHLEPSNFHRHSLQYKLERSILKPVGLQMVEEYTQGEGSSYYKCNLCGAHGKLDHIYYHIIGTKHTEKYIRSSYKLEGTVLTARERDHLREQLVQTEGIDVSVIRIIVGHDLYPKKWKAECRSLTKINTTEEPTIDVKEESRYSPPPSPSPSNWWPSSNTNTINNQRSPRLESPQRKLKLPRCDSQETSPSVHFRNTCPPPPPPIQCLSDQIVATPNHPEMQDKATQRFDLEELMVQLNFIVKSDTEIRTSWDAKDVIDMILKISDALHTLTKAQISDPSYKDEHHFNKLTCQKKALGKILAHVKQRMEESWRRHNMHSL
ncbi:hypothetical protein Pcinc_034211 [Petrolisthes cinctipes]|uniref:C2H2-type domain-containing protein n=1 Tax=Petrolisthes cinctipes TaxID=88211 RepID=A0AAE1EQP3_PETCI|nr:hypothetical protein Pcinc_034211 [Petrolisthes cinctipes]